MERYKTFKARHPRAALGASLTGALTIIGLAGLPNDLENWSAAFQAIGSDLGRWLLVAAGVCVGLALVASTKRQSDPPAEKPKSLGSAGRREHLGDIATTLPSRPLTYGDLETMRVPLDGSSGAQQAIPGNAPAPSLAEECTQVAQQIEDFVLERKTNDPGVHHRHDLPPDEHEAQDRREKEYWHETGRLFDHRFGSDTKRLLEALRDSGQISPERLEGMQIFRLGNVHPGEIADLAHLLRSTVHPARFPSSPPSLGKTLDDMIREGMDLRQELSASVEAEETSPGTWHIAGGVPEGWWEKVDAFDQRIRDLLRSERPALLGVYAERHNVSAREARESQESAKGPDHKRDTRSSAEKALAFANATRRGPVLHMDCILDGLAAARRQLGLEHPQAA